MLYLAIFTLLLELKYFNIIRTSYYIGYFFKFVGMFICMSIIHISIVNLFFLLNVSIIKNYSNKVSKLVDRKSLCEILVTQFNTVAIFSIFSFMDDWTINEGLAHNTLSTYLKIIIINEDGVGTFIE